MLHSSKQLPNPRQFVQFNAPKLKLLRFIDPLAAHHTLVLRQHPQLHPHNVSKQRRGLSIRDVQVLRERNRWQCAPTVLTTTPHKQIQLPLETTPPKIIAILFLWTQTICHQSSSRAWWSVQSLPSRSWWVAREIYLYFARSVQSYGTCYCQNRVETGQCIWRLTFLSMV